MTETEKQLLNNYASTTQTHIYSKYCVQYNLEPPSNQKTFLPVRNFNYEASRIRGRAKKKYTTKHTLQSVLKAYPVKKSIRPSKYNHIQIFHISLTTDFSSHKGIQ